MIRARFASLAVLICLVSCSHDSVSLTTIVVTPADPSILVDGTESFVAMGTYSNLTVIDITERVTWQASSAHIASISNSSGSAGVAHGLADGRTAITATMSGITGSTSMVVKSLVTIAVGPAGAAIAAGASEQLSATGTYSDASTADLTGQATWTSSSTAVATVGNATPTLGVVQGIVPGTTMVSAALGSISGTTTLAVTAPPTTSVAPNDSLLNFSDYYTLNSSSTATNFTRPDIDNFGYNYVAPAARIRFQTVAPYLVIHLSYTNLVTQKDVYNGFGAVLVNGSTFTLFNDTELATGAPAHAVDVQLGFGSTLSRTIEVLLPYDASVALTGIDIDQGSPLTAVSPRPSQVLLTLGDSITQGFFAQDITHTWPFLLTQAKGWQLLNGGYGGRTVVPTDAVALSPSGIVPVVITYQIGYNDFYLQEPLATFKENYTAYINNLRTANSTVPIYCITPLWTSHVAAEFGGTLEIESYRQQIRDVLSELNNPLNILVEGESLTGNSIAYFDDGIHPNDTGAGQIATALQAIIVQ